MIHRYHGILAIF